MDRVIDWFTPPVRFAFSHLDGVQLAKQGNDLLGNG
jgi:hypothetical protein